MNDSRNTRLERALGRALDYILRRQRQDGSWIDWDVPPAQSSIWTTAFVGCKLRGLSSQHRQQVAAASASAARYLRARIFPDGGWGYNELVESDADTTALAILFLASEGIAIPDACYACLESFQQPDGGFATYRGVPALGSWGASHMDATPAAVLALMTKYGGEYGPVARGLRFVLNSATPAGIWESFWWTSCLYSTQACLSLLKSAGLNLGLPHTRDTMMGLTPQSSFEVALLLSSLAFFPSGCELATQKLLDTLMDDQQGDGSWKSVPMLRVTRRDCFEPWKPGDPDRLYCDQNRLFTTAMALEALSLFQSSESAAEPETADHVVAQL